ncbi:MAG: glycosyltransferase family 87 protein [Chloroflexota bacterium]
MRIKKTLLIAFAGLVVVAGIVLLSIYFTSGDPLFDFTAFWIAAKLTLNGQDPYLQADWVPVYSQFETLGLADNQTFLYPKPILLLFLPFGALPLEIAAFIWLVLTQAAVLAAVYLLTSLWQIEKKIKYLIPLLVGLLIFRPYLLTLNLGQLSGFLLLILTIILLLWQNQKWLIAGILLSLLTLKPSLGFPIIGLVSLWFLTKKVWGHFIGLAIGGGGLMLLGWAFDPKWVSKFLEIGTSKVSATFGFHPTLWGLSGYLCGYQQTCALISGSILTIAFLTLFFVALWKKPDLLTPTAVLALSIPLALLLTPYLWAYDHLLLVLPLTVTIGLLIDQKRAYLLAASLPAALALVSILFLNVAVRIDNDTWSALVPLFSLLVLSIVLLAPPTAEKTG